MVLLVTEGAVQDVPRAAQHVQILISVQSLLVDVKVFDDFQVTRLGLCKQWPSDSLCFIKVQQLFHRTLYGNA